MLELYFWTTPNGYKPLLFLEELGLDYRLHPVNIGAGEQFEPDFLKISPNNKIPALVDYSPADGGDPLSVFESGAILQYLAEKHHAFLPDGLRGRTDTLQWLFWQMASVGPMLGQEHHFSRYAPEKIPYAIERYRNEAERLYGVLDERLEDRRFLCEETYTIADMACYPWIRSQESGMDFGEDYPQIQRWLFEIGNRPATQRAYEKGEQINRNPVVTEASRAILFGQGRRKR